MLLVSRAHLGGKTSLHGGYGGFIDQEINLAPAC